MSPRNAATYERVTVLPAIVRRRDNCCLPGATVWEDITAEEDAHSHCIPSALVNTPSPLLWVSC